MKIPEKTFLTILGMLAGLGVFSLAQSVMPPAVPVKTYVYAGGNTVQIRTGWFVTPGFYTLVKGDSSDYFHFHNTGWDKCPLQLGSNIITMALRVPGQPQQVQFFTVTTSNVFGLQIGPAAQGTFTIQTNSDLTNSNGWGNWMTFTNTPPNDFLFIPLNTTNQALYFRTAGPTP